MIKEHSKIFSIIFTILFGGILYYLMLPPFNIHSYLFWVFICILIIVFFVIYSLLTIPANIIYTIKGKKKNNNLKSYKLLFVIPIIIVSILLVNIILSPVFNSKSYYKRIEVKDDAKFTDDVKEVDFNKIPLLDKDSSEKLGDRTMGQMSELVSQFDVSNMYTQINYNDKIIRVTPLEYNGVIKYFTNRKNGVKGYITVDSTNGESKLTKLGTGMKYMPSALFNENLYRKLRFSYPTAIFEDMAFEIDNEGNPYFVAPIIKYSGVGLKKDVEAVVILDPITGNSKKYDVKDVPTWVDHVYPANLIIEQVDDWGQYKNGFFNTIFGQKGVVQTTTGYNYVVMNDDVYLYTGITSVISDESNIGFILTNLRTKETKFYNVPGAEEYSAMDSAKGQVQQMNYSSTFPLLVNLNNKPTYLISLKDNAGLVKMYAFVDVEDYQKVVVTDSSKGIQKAAENYLNDVVDDENIHELKTKEITIKTIKEVIIDGNTYYYITDNDNQRYKVSIKTNKNLLPFINNNDKVRIEYAKESEVITINGIEN
ncbi:MAG: CvpA family protein [Bacilli bacterium]|nr:CvpA family protein [Bacilli bacterium]